jgi:N-acetylated-alpha-linked acidic dipeptidase
VRVEQTRELTRTENVVGTLRGARFPEQKVIVGCHHDAWSFGAGDPNSGTIVVLAAARAFAEAAARGLRPDRTLIFAHWAAEEFGIQGSVEWVEAHPEKLTEGAVAYLNLDMASMGTELRGSASPTLETVLAEATRGVPKARDPETTVFADWTERSGRRDETELPAMGSLGGGSDHVGFYAHLGIPSAGLSAHGSPGVSYHTAYEDLAWYRQVVGDDYEPAVMVTRVTTRLLGRLANADLLPLDPALYGPETLRHLENLDKVAAEREVEVDLTPLKEGARRYGERSAAVRDKTLAALAAGRLDGDALAEANRILLHLERRWLDPAGLPGRPWFRNLFGAPDADAGYSAWMLPALRQAIETGDAAGAAQWVGSYQEVFDRLESDLTRLDALSGTEVTP